MLLKVKVLMQIIVKFRAKKILCTFLSCTKHQFEGTKYRARKQLYSSTLKRNKLKVCMSLKDNKLVCFANSQAHFKYTTWFMISEKYITRCMFLYRGTPMNQRSQQDMQKELCTRISNSFRPSIIFMWTSRFYRFEHVYL